MPTDTWQTLAQQARRAANKLGVDEPRSCVSRAYYAAYAKVTHELTQLANITFPPGREGPSHPGATAAGVGEGGVRRLILQTLTRLPADRRRKLSELVGELYALRLDADYHPSKTVSVRAARRALALMRTVFDAF